MRAAGRGEPPPAGLDTEQGGPPHGRALSSERSLLMHRAFTWPRFARGFVSVGGVGFVAMWVAMSGGCGSGTSGTGQAARRAPRGLPVPRRPATAAAAARPAARSRRRDGCRRHGCGGRDNRRGRHAHGHRRDGGGNGMRAGTTGAAGRGGTTGAAGTSGGAGRAARPGPRDHGRGRPRRHHGAAGTTGGPGRPAAPGRPGPRAPAAHRRPAITTSARTAPTRTPARWRRRSRRSPRPTRASAPAERSGCCPGRTC